MAKNCQSCGMPMNKDVKGGGSNADGSISTEYCSFCYQDGAFTQTDITVSEMQEFCIVKLKEMGVPKFMGWVFTRNIPKLDRWK